MKLRIVSDGTCSGTTVLDEDGNHLSGVTEINWSVTAGKLSVARLVISNVKLEAVGQLDAMARAAYDAYGATTDYKNFRGEPMPTFDDLPETIRSAWVAAVAGALRGQAR